MRSTQIEVKLLDGRWTIGREGWPFQTFASKDLALRRARLLVKRIEGAEVVVEDEPPKARQAGDR
jgi:hypothetical protein